MPHRSCFLVPVALLATTLVACGSDESVGHGNDVVGGGPEPVHFDLTEDLGCGYGFARTDEHATQLLQVYYHGDEHTLDAMVRLPDPDWTATIEEGQRLDANWCNDVIIDPQAKVERTWTIVEGTLTFVGGAPRLGGGSLDEPVRARLTGVVAEGPDGERATVPDVPLSNVSFGLFAG
jgi:hypothetical protein